MILTKWISALSAGGDRPLGIYARLAKRRMAALNEGNAVEGEEL
jgi:hypothetical protein